jgi:opacity protein-like surface antigen
MAAFLPPAMRCGNLWARAGHARGLHWHGPEVTNLAIIKGDMMRTVLRFATAGLLLASSTAALAQRADDKFFLKGGAFLSWVNSEFQINGDNGQIGSDVDLEKDFGLGSDGQAGPYALLGWRFSKHWRVEFEYFSLGREATKIIDRDLIIGDTTYPVNGEVTAGLFTDVYRLSVGWSFLHGEDYELGANLGFYLSDFGVYAEGSGCANGVCGSLQREQRDQLVPLPTLGFYGRYDLSKVWSLNARADYFSIKIDQYKGSIIDVSGGVSARVTKNIGLGVDFRYIDYGLRASAQDFTGQVNYNFYGPFFFIELGF